MAGEMSKAVEELRKKTQYLLAVYSPPSSSSYSGDCKQALRIRAVLVLA
jgi:hypothetical protein